MSKQLRRSVLYVPADNERALAKLSLLNCDSVVFDLEDSVAPARKADARNRLKDILSRGDGRATETIVRVNALSTEWGADDIAVLHDAGIDAFLLPKVDTADHIRAACDALEQAGASPEVRIWAMIETPLGIVNVNDIALTHAGRRRLDCLIVGSNDIVKDTGIQPGRDRTLLIPWLLQIVLAAKAGGLHVLDGVYNDFRDAEGLAAECRAGASLGFDGKTLIHPSQIDIANSAFYPSAETIQEAREIVAAFDLPHNADKGVISLDGRMVELLHKRMAEDLLERVKQ